ncbi:MAG TPA: YggT family protein [Bacillota bacterium]
MLVVVLAQTVESIFRIFFWLIFLRALLSWIRPASYNKLYADVSRVVFVLTEPILAPIRDRLPMHRFGLDFSPFIAMILLSILQDLAAGLIIRLFG